MATRLTRKTVALGNFIPACWSVQKPDITRNSLSFLPDPPRARRSVSAADRYGPPVALSESGAVDAGGEQFKDSARSRS
jgi:hypothetical protein